MYIGGEIVNPNARYLVLKKNGLVIDTLPLNEKNSFSYKFNHPEEGIYLIKHRPETQNIYLYPGDSLLFRVNTLAFDESIHFSGTGAHRNNLMAEMFLEDEANTDLILSYYKTPPAEFERKADSIYEERLRQLEQTDQKRGFSDEFVELARKVIDYESYDFRERYIYLVHKYNKEYLPKISKRFHDYRTQVNFNDQSLQSSTGYRRFIDNYLINQWLKSCANGSSDSRDCFDLTSTGNILARLDNVAELIHLPHLRNYFLTKLGVLGIVTADSKEDMASILQSLQEKNFAAEELKDMRQLAAIQTAFVPGTQLQSAPLITARGDTLSIKEVLNQPTVLFLWSLYNRNHQQDHALIRGLRKKYPQVNFVGLNIDVGEREDWLAAVEDNGYNSKKEFQLGQTGINKKFFQYFLNKLLLIDSTGKVVIGDAFINSPELESHILLLLNK